MHMFVLCCALWLTETFTVRQCTHTTRWYNHPQVSSHLLLSTMCISKAVWRASATRGGGLTYLKMVGNFRYIDPRFWHFPIAHGSHFMPNSILLIPSFCRKNQFVSIAFSSRDNLTYSWSNISLKSVIWLF